VPRPNSFAVIGGDSDDRIIPPPDLKGEPLQLFLNLVMACRAEHFQPSDAFLLASYCRALVLERDATELIQKDPAGATTQLVKVQQSSLVTVYKLAIRLRLSPQGRQPTLPPYLNRLKASTNESYYDRMRLEKSDDD
jgi:hypothetical protein